MKILAIMLSLFLLQATTAVAQTSTSTTDAIKNYSVEKKNEAAAHSKKLVSDFDTKIKDLETQISKDTSAAGADAKRQGEELKGVTDLKAARGEAAQKAGERGQGSAGTWNGAKQAFADSYKDLQKAYDAAVAKVKK